MSCIEVWDEPLSTGNSVTRKQETAVGGETRKKQCIKWGRYTVQE